MSGTRTFFSASSIADAGSSRVDALERGAQAPREDDFGEVVALGRQLLGLHIRAEGDFVAEAVQPGERRFFDMRFDDGSPGNLGPLGHGRACVIVHL